MGSLERGVCLYARSAPTRSDFWTCTYRAFFLFTPISGSGHVKKKKKRLPMAKKRRLVRLCRVRFDFLKARVEKQQIGVGKGSKTGDGPLFRQRKPKCSLLSFGTKKKKRSAGGGRPGATAVSFGPSVFGRARVLYTRARIGQTTGKEKKKEKTREERQKKKKEEKGGGGR